MIYAPMAYAPTDEKFTPDASWIMSAFEVNQFNTKQHQLGDKYGFYIDDSVPTKDKPPYIPCSDRALATTWMGDILGSARLGKPFHHNFGGKSRKVWITDKRGNIWHGQYSFKNQDYVYAKLIKLGK